MPAATGKILVIEDDEDTRANLREILELDDYEVETAPTAAQGIALARAGGMTAIILDRRLPDGEAIDVLPRLRQVAPDADVLIVTGYSDLEGAVAALRQGAADYILKPLNPEALRASLLRIAERQRLASEKRRTDQAFRNLIEVAECLIVIMRPDLSILYLSPFGERLTGYLLEEVKGRNAVEALHVIRPREVTAEAVRLLKAGRPVRGLEDQILCRDGSRRDLVWNARRLDDYEGEPAFLAVGQDITPIKRAQERAVQAERLAAIGQMVTGLAHESRNALQRSQACLEMLSLEVQDRPAAIDLIRRLQIAQDHLTHLYEDVRGYAAPLRLDRRDADIAGAWRAAWSHLAHHPRHQGAVLHEIGVCPDTTCPIDPFRMEQVFRNIFENALTAGTTRSRVEIDCRLASFEGSPAFEVRVRDHGHGMDVDTRNRMFEPFFTTKTRGTGLGMAIVKRIVEAHGGRISVAESSPAGTVILLILPRGTP